MYLIYGFYGNNLELKAQQNACNSNAINCFLVNMVAYSFINTIH